jgi:cytochrome c oxidase subunit I
LARFFSLDHNVVGLQYALTSLFFLLIGFSLAILFRWQLAYPGQPVPIGGRWLGELNAPGGMMLPEFYNQLVAMHYGTIMGPESGNRMLAVVRSRALRMRGF